jgi:hypothetical protein
MNNEIINTLEEALQTMQSVHNAKLDVTIDIQNQLNSSIFRTHQLLRKLKLEQQNAMEMQIVNATSRYMIKD